MFHPAIIRSFLLPQSGTNTKVCNYTMCRELRDFRILIPKWHVFIKSFLSGLRELCEREGDKILGVGGDGQHQGNHVFQTQQDWCTFELRDSGSMHRACTYPNLFLPSAATEYLDFYVGIHTNMSSCLRSKNFTPGLSSLALFELTLWLDLAFNSRSLYLYLPSAGNIGLCYEAQFKSRAFYGPEKLAQWCWERAYGSFRRVRVS